MKRLAIHKLRDRYFTPIFYTTYNAQFAHDYRLLCFQMYFRTRTGTMEPTKSHKVALINHSAILHLSRSIGVNGYVCNRSWTMRSRMWPSTWTRPGWLLAVRFIAVVKALSGAPGLNAQAMHSVSPAPPPNYGHRARPASS